MDPEVRRAAGAAGAPPARQRLRTMGLPAVPGTAQAQLADARLGLRPSPQAMKAMSEVADDPSKLDSWAHKPALYRLLKKVTGR